MERVLTRDGEATGVALADGTEIAADVVVSALDPRRTFLELVDPRELPDDLVEDIRRLKFQGVSSKVNFALDGAADAPGARRTAGPVPRLHEHRSVDRLPGARLRRRQVRLVQRATRTSTAPSSRRSTRTWRRPASTSSPASCSTRRTGCARATGTRSASTMADRCPGGAGALLPRLRRPGPAARGADAARHRAHGRPVGGEHLRRRVPGAADVLLPPRARLGAVPDPDARATTSAARGRTRAAA